MNTTKKINVNVSSLVGLKAELLRKHTEVKDAKAKIDTNKPILPKTRVKSKKVKAQNEKTNDRQKITEIEDVDTLKKSKYMLLAKSKLYDKLKKNHESNDNYLVDFKNKHYESSEDESSIEDDYEDTNIDPEEDWIDYKDCFGRTRRCLRKDLPRMREKDSIIEQEISKKPFSEQTESHIQPPVFIPPEKEPEIEIMRKKWEEQTEKLAKKSDIHYQDILFDEARAHGVGYYAFSQNEDERAKQQENLMKLRRETEQKQRELEEIKNLKNKMEENRLRTARIRARIRAGLPPEPTEEEIANNPPKVEPNSANENPEPKSPKNDESEENPDKSKSSENSLIVIEDKIKAFGELLGKRLPWRELSQEEWIHKRRKDRQGEFAPVYDNFQSAGTLTANKHNQLMTKDNGENDDPLRIHAGGPEPTDIWESSAPSHDNEDNEVATARPNNPGDILTPEQSDVPMNSSEFSSFVHPVLPPTFDPSVPPPPLNYPESTSFKNSITLQKTSMDVGTTTINHESSNESTDSDDSDIIGPMPPSSFSSTQDDILAEIPLPENPPSKIQKLTSNSLDTQQQNHPANSNMDKIEAGLKYLRQKFETNDGS